MKNYLRTADCPLYRTHRALSTAPRPTLPYPNLAPAQVLLFENEKQAISSVPSRWFITVPSASPGQHPDLKITPANAPIVIINELCEFEWDPGCSDCLLNHQGSQGGCEIFQRMNRADWQGEHEHYQYHSRNSERRWEDIPHQSFSSLTVSPRNSKKSKNC